MPATALKYLEKFEQYANVDISDDPCFKAAKNILKPFDKSQINRDSLVMKQHKGNLGVFCRPFGFFMNSKSDWIPTKAVISNTQTDFLVTFKSQYISTKNGSTSYSVLFWAVLNEENSDAKIFDSFSDDFLNNPNCKQITLLKNRPEIKAYEIFDKEKYSQFGGGHAILVHFTKEYSEDADVKMESAEDFSAHPSIKNGVNFIRYKAAMCRANVPVTYFIMLDTCTFIYEESKKDFVNFIEACEFY